MIKIIFLVIFLLSGCSEVVNSPLLFKVKKQTFKVNVLAKGELFAAKATSINAPHSRRGVQNLAWLAPEFSFVKKGEVIARFDGEAMEIASRNRENDLAITLQEIIEKNSVLNKELDAINKDIDIVGQERFFAEKFTIEDEAIMSKLDIVDAMQNTAYLGAKQGYLHWKEGSFSESSTGEMDLLEMKQKQHQNKLNSLTDSLSQLEVKAPHDGLLSYKANWRGEKPRAGQAIWPGHKIAEIPDISQMKAKLFVLESEAIGLAVGKKVNLLLDAYINSPFTGVIHSVAPFPQSIKRGDPQKYFEVIVTLHEQNPALFLPGRKLQANINIAEDEAKLVVPLQSIYSKQNESYVYVYRNSKFEITKVTLGQASLSHVEVTSGLSAGQSIALVNMEES